jgi:hypothetical protein
MGLSVEGWGIVIAAISMALISGTEIYKNAFKPTEQSENTFPMVSPPTQYQGIYNRTPLGGTLKRQRKNKSRRK